MSRMPIEKTECVICHDCIYVGQRILTLPSGLANKDRNGALFVQGTLDPQVVIHTECLRGLKTPRGPHADAGGAY